MSTVVSSCPRAPIDRRVVRPRHLTGALVLGGLLAAPIAAAPGGWCPLDGWSPPQDLCISEGRVHNPILLADPSGTVHLFYTERELGRNKPVESLSYARWTDGRWSAVQKILMPAEGEGLRQPAMGLDSRGWLHFIYQGPRWGSLAYHRVPLSQVTDPSVWRRSAVVSHIGVLDSAIAIAARDVVHILYSSNRHHLFSIRSDDDGRSWSQRVQISSQDPTLEATIGPRLAVDDRGRLHAVWAQSHLPKGWPPAGVYYARSTDAGRTWSAPLQVAGELYAQPNVIARGDVIHLVWGSTAVPGHRVHQWSEDGGDTWRTPQLIDGRLHGGITGAPAIALDSAGTLHLVTSVDGPRSVERIFHLSWDGERWSAPELLSEGTAATDSVEWPGLAISGGSQLHVVYEGDYKRLWYTSAHVTAPAVAPRPVPTPATDLWTRAKEASLSFRILLLVLGLLAVDAGVRALWRWRPRGWRSEHAG